MMMVAFSVVMTVVVLNFHHRKSETNEMPFAVSSGTRKFVVKTVRQVHVRCVCIASSVYEPESS